MQRTFPFPYAKSNCSFTKAHLSKGFTQIRIHLVPKTRCMKTGRQQTAEREVHLDGVRLTHRSFAFTIHHGGHVCVLK